MADDKPIIVIKKKGHHGGHHGGAWKVAYADFVTAMMAFFMVMWLVNSASNPTKEAIASYFRSPGYFKEGASSPILAGQPGILPDGFVPSQWHPGKKHIVGRESSMHLKSQAGTDPEPDLNEVTPPENKVKGLIEGEADTYGFAATPAPYDPKMEIQNKLLVRKVAKELEGIIESSVDLTKLLGMLDVKVESDGLTIEIMDTDKTSMFASGSAKINPEAESGFRLIADAIKDVPNSIEIIGHTDAKPFGSRFNSYSNWELSADRANAARRLLEQAGIAPQRIKSVLGKADREPRNKENPLSSENRRITLKVKFPQTITVNAQDGFDDISRMLKDNQGIEVSSAAEGEKAISEGKGSESKAKDPNTISLEGREPPTGNPAYSDRDPIFQDQPLIGPGIALFDY